MIRGLLSLRYVANITHKPALRVVAEKVNRFADHGISNAGRPMMTGRTTGATKGMNKGKDGGDH
jgi:hypothetical protein